MLVIEVRRVHSCFNDFTYKHLGYGITMTSRERHGVSNEWQQADNNGNIKAPITDEFPSQRANNAETMLISRRVQNQIWLPKFWLPNLVQTVNTKEQETENNTNLDCMEV